MLQADEFEMSLESGDFPCDRLRVHTFTGKEAISRLFEYDIEVVCLDPEGPSTEAMVGAKVTLVIQRVPGPTGGWHGTQRLHGMVAEVEDVLTDHVDTAVYRLRVVPRAFALTLVHTQDIFLNLSVPDIVKAKVAAVNLGDAMAMRLSSAYPERDFVVQYKESDLAFVSRLTEHLGISFFFEQGDAGDTMVFTDQSGGFSPSEAGPVTFRGRGEHIGVFALHEKRRVIPAYYVVNDYNYRTPLLDLSADHEIPQGFGGGVIEYGSHHKTPDEGQVLARVRAEEQQATELVYTGRSDVAALGAGTRFTVVDHPTLGSVDLVVIEIEHRASQAVAPGEVAGGTRKQGYENTFRAIPAARTYRPARVTPRPRIHGLVTGVIEQGPGAAGPSKYARIDQQGRYLVRFLFDTTPPGGAATSRPVRMLQNHAGENYGTHYPLKPGVEVLIGFLDGDPDRPLIVGAVPNPIKPSPVDSSNPGLHRVKTLTGITVDMAD
jgi:type VI secretion system secreted protein VgrG